MASKLFVKTGDTVRMITGEDKGHADVKKFTSVRCTPAIPRRTASWSKKVNMVTRQHQKPRGQGMPGGIIEKEAPIDASNVMLVCPKCGKATRVGHKYLDGEAKPSRRKVRVCKECGATFDK